MTKITIHSRDEWAKERIASAINTETQLLQKAIAMTRSKIEDFEARYGKLDRKKLYGKIDDMELLEWEGETEVLTRLREKLKSLSEVTFEFE